ncbi:MAG: hypothetical protein ACJ8OJ_16005 [Povalibacter sp.]
MAKDSVRFTKTDPRIRRQAKAARENRSLSTTGSFKRRLTEQELMELEALEMSMHDSEERVVSYFEWQERTNRPASATTPSPRVGPIKRLFFRLTGRG